MTISMREVNEAALRELVRQLETTRSPADALGEAARWGLRDELDRLLDAGVAPDSPIGENQVTALMLAGKKCTAKRLLERGANPNACDKRGISPLIAFFRAMYRKNEAISRIKLLLDFGADVRLKDNEGMTAYDHAKKKYDDDVLSLLNPDGAR